MRVVTNSFTALFLLAGSAASEPEHPLCAPSAPVAIADILIANPARQDFERMSRTLEQLDDANQFLDVGDTELAAYDNYRRAHFPNGSGERDNVRAAAAIDFENQIARSISNLIQCDKNGTDDKLGLQAKRLMKQWEKEAQAALHDEAEATALPDRSVPPAARPVLSQP